MLTKHQYLPRAVNLTGLPSPYLLAAWTLSMISLPIVKYFWGEAGMLVGVVIGVLLQVGVVLAVLYPAWGLTRTVYTAVLVVILGWAVEAIGSTTGFPFGAYHYTDKLHPQLAGVPFLIPLAWLMMLPPAWAVSYLLVGQRSGLAFIAYSALAMTAWDLFLDPQMVAWGLWVWDEPGSYFGIPWVNYLGWLLASALITAAARPGPLPVRPLVFIYVVTWLLETIGLFFFWGLPGPAVVGFVAMGGLLAAAYLKHQNVK
jgi:putative membrane protein